MKSSLVRLAFAFVFAALLYTPVMAQTEAFPSRPVRIVVPVAAGGLKDVVVRAISRELSRMWKQPVLVENRLGAAHIVATGYVAKSPADGYTLIATDKPWTANPFLYKELPYDGVNALVPVVNFAQLTEILLVTPALAINSLQDLLIYARQNPGKLNYGSFGVGSNPHIDMEALAHATGLKLTHVAYKGGVAEILPALMNNEIQIAFTAVPPVLAAIKKGDVKAIGYGASKRAPLLPDVPTFKEQGLDFETWAWSGLLAPAGTPRPIIDKIAADIREVLAMPEIREKYYDNVGMEMLFLGPDEFKKLLDEDRVSFADLAKKIGLKPE